MNKQAPAHLNSVELGELGGEVEALEAAGLLHQLGRHQAQRGEHRQPAVLQLSGAQAVETQQHDAGSDSEVEMDQEAPPSVSTEPVTRAPPNTAPSRDMAPNHLARLPSLSLSRRRQLHGT